MLAISLTSRLPFNRLAAAIAGLVLFAPLAVAQAPPGLDANAPPPALNLKDLFAGPGLGLGGQGGKVSFSASYTIEKESRRGLVTVAVTIEPGWHIYSLTQPV